MLLPFLFGVQNCFLEKSGCIRVERHGDRDAVNYSMLVLFEIHNLFYKYHSLFLRIKHAKETLLVILCQISRTLISSHASSSSSRVESTWDIGIIKHWNGTIATVSGNARNTLIPKDITVTLGSAFSRKQ